MHVQNETELTSFRDWTLRVRAATKSPARLLLLLHGWTGDENSMWVFVRNFAADYWIVAPRAPHETQPSGYSWRPQRHGEHDWPNFENLRPAVDALIPFVDAYAEENHLDGRKFDVMGFSQGAVLAITMALLNPERIARAAVLSGFVPEGAESLARSRPLDGKPIFVSHGTLDETVPIAQARRSVKLLEDAGAQVAYCEDEVGHKLSLGCLRELEAFFA